MPIATEFELTFGCGHVGTIDLSTLPNVSSNSVAIGMRSHSSARGCLLLGEVPVAGRKVTSTRDRLFRYR